MENNKYKHLFTPIETGGTVFRNRIFASPEGFYHVSTDCLPNAEEAQFFERKAMGGFASVCIGDCIVDIDTGRHYPFLCNMKDPDTLPGLSAVASAISRHGAVASAELSHAGMYAQDTYARTGKLYGPVEMDGKYGHVEEMTEEMILNIVKDFGAAAAWAKRCGFGMVTIHGGHGWLLSQFFSRNVNKRTDAWGGSLENRLRLPLAVVESVRKAVGRRFPIEIRISGSECNPDGYDIEEGVQLAKALDGKVDIIHVSAGHHEVPSAMVITHPSMFLPDCCNLKYAAEIKKHVNTPVATVGAFTSPDEMEEAIASGSADIVEVGRQSLADPDLPIKARLGKEDEIRRCIRCMNCFGGEGEHRIAECSLNPEISHEKEYEYAPAPKVLKKVLVIGGGPGGMEAALTCKMRGHEVILCEKSGQLGGALRCEKLVPFKQKTMDYLDLQAHLLEKYGVDVRLNTEMTPAKAMEIGPDVIIAAVGAKPMKLPITGIDKALCAEDVYLAPEKCGDSVVIMGGGLVGIELGLFLAELGKQITIVEMAPKLTVHEFSMHTLALMDQIEKRGLKILTSHAAKEVTEEGLIAAGPDGDVLVAADTVVYAVGQIPQRAEALAFNDCAPEFHMLGDCIVSKNIQAATSLAHRLAYDIGRY